MPYYDDPQQTFLNRRDWNSYISKLQTAASYPKLLEAFKSSRAWFAAGATEASDWLVGAPELSEKLVP